MARSKINKQAMPVLEISMISHMNGWLDNLNPINGTYAIYFKTFCINHQRLRYEMDEQQLG